jgi:hypothetical protein
LGYMPCPPHLPWLDHSNYTWRRVQAYAFYIGLTRNVDV